MVTTGVDMPFGKHKGRDLGEVPTSYLCWAIHECNSLNWWLRSAIRQELERRQAPCLDESEPAPQPAAGPSPDWAGTIRQWHRDLVLRHHPDRGGDGKIMA